MSFTLPQMVTIRASQADNYIEPIMQYIQKGEFLMGSKDGDDDEKPHHKVKIDYHFMIGKYQVTFDEYDLFCEDIKRDKPDDKGWGRGRRPVINIDWNDAVEYCKWISEKTKREYRLPSEAEWEYSCRAETKTKWSFGDDEEKLKEYAWYNKNSDNKTHEVGELKPNPWNLYDTHGNVWEWCEDNWVDNYKDTPLDGSANKADKNSSKLLRGGSWVNDSNDSRSAIRFRDFPDNRGISIGFRLLGTLPL